MWKPNRHPKYQWTVEVDYGKKGRVVQRHRKLLQQKLKRAALVTIPEEIDGYREKGINIASVEQVEFGSIMEVSVPVQEGKTINTLSLLCDLGYVMKPVLAIDAKATEHILHGQGIGHLKHIDVAHLWIEDEVRSNKIECGESRVRSWHQSAPQRAVISKHSVTWENAHMGEEKDELRLSFRSRCSRRVFGQAACRAQLVAMPNTGNSSGSRSSSLAQRWRVGPCGRERFSSKPSLARSILRIRLRIISEVACLALAAHESKGNSLAAVVGWTAQMCNSPQNASGDEIEGSSKRH